MPDKKQHATPCMSVEGFDSIVAYAHERQMANHVRGLQVVDAWLEYPSAEGGQIVEWDTAPVPETTGLIAFSWTCLLGGGQVSCNHHLFLNGSELLRFQTPICRKRVWRGKDCVLRFDSVGGAQNGESYGVMTLTVPATRLHFGASARIKVAGGVAAVSNFSFFALLNFMDTVAYADRERTGVIQLAEGGRDKAVIVCPRGATRVERFAAEELRRYVRAISGARLPVKTCRDARDQNVIFLGQPGVINKMDTRFCLPAIKDDDDRICMKTVPGALALTGSRSRGVLFAVYRFLHRLGCRWFEPGPCGEWIPREQSLRSGNLDVVEIPSFRIRAARPTEDQYIYTVVDVLEHIDWACKQGMNSFHFLIPAYERLRPVIVSEMRKRGMRISVGDHTFKKWLPHTLFDQHPEYFPEVKGVRIRGGSARCASNPAAVKFLADHAAAWARKYPELDEIRIGCDDGSIYCGCAGCRQMRPVEQLQVFHNAAARAIHRIYPDKHILISAYVRHYEPSRKIRPYTKNVAVMFDTFVRCQTHALNDPHCPKINSQGDSYNEAAMRAPGINRYLCLALKQWRALFRDVMIFENVMLHGRKSTFFPMAGVLAADLRYYKDTGIAGFTPQADLIRWAPAARELYLAARMVWDVELNLRDLDAEFFTGYYGVAAGAMRRFFALLDLRVSTRCCQIILDALTEADIARLRKLLDRARRIAVTKQSSVAIARIVAVFEHTFLLWRLNNLQFRMRAFLRCGRKEAVRKLHNEIVACARSLIRFDENHQHENIIFFQHGSLRGMLANCLNGYSAEMDVHRVDLTGLLENAVNLQNQEGVARALKDRMRWQAQTGLTVNRSK